MASLVWGCLFLLCFHRAWALDPPPPPTKEQCAAGQQGTVPLYDCHFEAQASPEACAARGCCWALASEGKPSCYIPQGFSYFQGNSTVLQRKYRSPFPDDVNNLRIDVTNGDNHVGIRIVDADNDRWVPPYPQLNTNWNEIHSPAGLSYEVYRDTPEGELLKIVRNGKQVVATDALSLSYSDQLVQMAFNLSGASLFGIGEHRSSFMLNDQWTKFTLWNHDGVPKENTNLYGSQPFILAVDASGNATGVYFHNSNAVEILIQPGPVVTFRSIGGILEFHILLGPSPADVISQYTKLVGLPAIPPYWGLGYQICRWGYGGTRNVRLVWDSMVENRIPFDVQWNDIDYMRQNNDFTIDPDSFGDLPEVVDDLHAAGLHYVPMIDPGVSGGEEVSYPPFTDGKEMDIFVKDINGEIFYGKVWNPKSTVFPDYLHPRVSEYFTKQLRELHDTIKYDAMWLDMGEPSNGYNGLPEGCPENKLETPPYVPPVVGGKLQTSTLCMTAQHAVGPHYNVHNIYGTAETAITKSAIELITGKRTFLISRANSAGLGRYSGHWSGDNDATWEDLRASILELLTFSLYGVPFMGADICGFNNHADRELCNRWHQLGAFYTFSRNHNTIFAPDQWPFSYDEEVTNSIRKVLELRYSLLPYLYTLFYQANVNGATVARPLFFEFPADTEARKVERSFLWGSGLYIAPVLDAGATSVNVYLPDARWFNLVTSQEISNNGFVDLPAPFDTIPVLIRGGNIIPSQPPQVTTTLSRKGAMSITVAPDSNGSAKGQLYWDDGDSLDPIGSGSYGLVDFELSDQKVTGTVRQWKTDDLKYGSIIILGVSSVSNVTLNGQQVDFTVNQNSKTLTVMVPTVRLADSFAVTWK